MTMAKTISKKISVKDSAANSLGKPPTRDKTLGVEPEILFYELEDVDETTEGEEVEIIFVHDSNLRYISKNSLRGGSHILICSIMKDLQ